MANVNQNINVCMREQFFLLKQLTFRNILTID